MTSAPRDEASFPLWPWVAAFVVHRALVVALAFDGVSFWEETYRLLVAEALRGGWHIGWTDLQADPYNGGSLVFSALAALASSVVAPSLLLLKGVALAWNAAGLALWLRIADRIAGRSAAHLLGFFWLAAPPVFVVFNVVALGSHSDTVTLVGAAWLAMLRYVDDPQRGAAKLALWMSTAGLAVWFGYTAALPLAVGALWAIAAGALPPSRWPLAALAFAAGISPWIAYNAAAGGTMAVVAQTFAGRGAAASRGYVATLADLVAHGTPVALYFRDIGIPGDVKLARDWLQYPYLAIYAGSFAASFAAAGSTMLRRLREGAARGARVQDALLACPELPLLLLFPAFLAVVAASNQEFNDYGTVRWITFRILVPALPSAFLAMALAASRMRAALRAPMLLLAGALAVAGSGQLLADGAELHALREQEARHDGAEAMGHLIVFKHGTAPVFASIVEAMPAELREDAYRGLGFSFACLYGTKRAEAPVAQLTAALRSVPPAWKDVAIAGARAALDAGRPQVAPLPPSPRRDAIAAAIEQAAGAPAPDASRDLAALPRR